MKATIAFYDAHTIDQTYFRDTLGSDYEVLVTDQPLTLETVPFAASAEIIAIHITSQANAEVLAKLPKLKHIACRTTGFDHVDLAYANAHNITVSSVPSYGENTVAEYAFMLMLAVSRRLIPTVQAFDDGYVDAEKLTGFDLSGKTLGVIGTGRIGRHSATIGRGFNMNVIGYDAYPMEEAARQIGYEYVSLDELYARADFITLHAPATPDTYHLLDAAAFAKMKPGAIVVNTARGTLIDTPALIEALKSKKIGGAGLDVLEGEEYFQIAPELNLLASNETPEQARQILGLDILTKMPNVVITPHNAYNSAEALGRIRDTTAANIRAFSSAHPQNLVS